MLVLHRENGGVIVCELPDGRLIEIVMIETTGNGRAKIGVDAPSDIVIHRREVYDRIRITICEQWRHSFPSFLAYIGARPSPKHTIDRIDTNKGYEPGNIRWATQKEQQRNRRNNHVVEFAGRKLLLCEWAELFGIGAYVISCRLRRGWSVERTLTEPVRRAGARPRVLLINRGRGETTEDAA